MVYDLQLAERLRALTIARPEITEKKMFGGLCFFLNGHMLCGVAGQDVMYRVGKEQEAHALKQPGASLMDFTGRPMRGFIVVHEDACDDKALEAWLAMAEVYVGSMTPKKPKKKKAIRSKRNNERHPF